MEESKETNKILQRILELLAKNEARISTNEISAEGDNLLDKAEKEGEEFKLVLTVFTTSYLHSTIC